MLIPLNRPVTGDSRMFPIAAFDGSRIMPRLTPIKTLGDLLDYGRATIVACGCKMSVTEIPAIHYLNLKNPPPEDTPIRDLADWLTCKECKSKKEVTVRESGFSKGNSEPRKGFLVGPYFTPPMRYVPALPLETPNPPPPDRPKTSHARKRYR